MYKVELQQGIHKIMKFYYQIGLWHRGDQTTARETKIKLLYSIIYSLFVISIVVGAFTTENTDESIFLAAAAVVASVGWLKVFNIIWRKKEILELLHCIGEHFMKDEEQVTFVNEKMETFMKLTVVLFSTTMFGSFCAAVGIPLLGSERKQFLNVGFPFDWRTSDVVYWLEFAFNFTGVLLSDFSFLFSILMWYLLFNCALKYDVLAHRLRNMGATKSKDKRRISERESENAFARDLVEAMESHKDIHKYFRCISIQI